MASRTCIRRVALFAAASSALLAASPAHALWYRAVLLSGKPGDAAMFGRLGIAVDGNRAVVANGTNGPAAFNMTVTSAVSPYTTEAFQPFAWGTPVQGIAVVGDEAFVGCGNYLYRFTRDGDGFWDYSQYWNMWNTVCDVAADGNVVAVTFGVSASSGALTVLEKIGGTWTSTYTAYSTSDFFGQHVEVQDLPDFQLIGQPASTKRQARIIVSAKGADTPVNDAGAAYIYEQSFSAWACSATLNAAVPTGGDMFGGEVALDGSYAYVTNAGSGSVDGVVEVFHKGAAGWARITTIQPTWGFTTIYFGRAIDADGDRIVISDSGYAFLFQRSGSTFSWVTSFVSNDPEGDPNFGYSVALDGDSVMVGGGNTATGEGTVHFFQDH